MEALYRCMLVVVIGALTVEQVVAAQHVVGGSQGWDESTDFETWASANTFKVGDQLVFRYNPGLHSVVELGSESAYKSCDTSSPVNSLSGGNDVVKLNKAGSRYFACGTAGHCEQGMKLKVTTVTGNAPSNPASTTSTSSAATTSIAPHLLLPPFVFVFVFFLLPQLLILYIH